MKTRYRCTIVYYFKKGDVTQFELKSAVPSPQAMFALTTKASKVFNSLDEFLNAGFDVKTVKGVQAKAHSSKRGHSAIQYDYLLNTGDPWSAFVLMMARDWMVS